MAPSADSLADAGLFEAEDPCQLCPNGITFAETAAATLSDEAELAETASICEDVVQYAKVLEAGSSQCLEHVSIYEFTCCPDPDREVCPMCPDNIVVKEGIVMPDIGDCADLPQIVAASPEGPEHCGMVGIFAALCCPVPAADPCELPCPSGTSFDGDAPATEIFLDGGDPDLVDFEISCGEVASSIEAGSAACELASSDFSELRLAFGELCCAPPSGADAESPTDVDANKCTLCPDGFTVQFEDSLASCKMRRANLALYSADNEIHCTEEAKLFDERECCPTPVENNPCTICPGGITASLGGFGYTKEMCEDGIDKFASYPADDNCYGAAVDLMRRCCPVPVEDPCQLCPDGLAPPPELVGEEDLALVMDYCESGIQFVATLEADDPYCPESKEEYEFQCCPVPGGPCEVCAGRPVEDDGPACGSIIEEAAFYPESSVKCPPSRVYEAFCCPVPAATPCKITCEEGYEFDEDGDANMNFKTSCSEAASYIEDGSDVCDSARQDFQSTCCVPQDSLTIGIVMESTPSPAPSPLNLFEGGTTPSPVAPGQGTKAPSMVDTAFDNTTLSPVAITGNNATTDPVGNATVSPVMPTAIPGPEPTEAPVRAKTDPPSPVTVRPTLSPVGAPTPDSGAATAAGAMGLLALVASLALAGAA